MDLPYRQRFQFLLELIYGDTFKPKAFWARHPDPDEFFYALFRVAKPDLPRTAFVGDVFELSAETLHNEVNALALGRLGVSSEQLLRLFQHNAAVEHPQEQGKEKGKWVRVVDSTLPAEVKTGAEGKTTLFVPTPTEETEYRPNIPNGWRPGPTRGKRDRGSKGHSGVFLTQQALKAVGENAPVISPGVNTKYMEQRRAFIANGKVDAPVTAATKKKDTNGKGKNAGSILLLLLLLVPLPLLLLLPPLLRKERNDRDRRKLVLKPRKEAVGVAAVAAGCWTDSSRRRCYRKWTTKKKKRSKKRKRRGRRRRSREQTLQRKRRVRNNRNQSWRSSCSNI